MPSLPTSPLSWSRREFIAGCAGAAAWAAGGATGSAAVSASERGAATAAATTLPGAWHVFAKPFHALSYGATAELIAEAGFGGIDFTVRPGGHVLPERVKEDLPRAVEAARAAGLRVDMITTGILSLATPHAESVLRTAADLGITVYRLGMANYDRALGVLGTLAKVKRELAELAELNAKLGLHGGFQNHAGTWRLGAAGWDLYEVLRELDPRWLGCQYDIRHATAVSGTSWPVTLELLQPWIRSTVAKDFRWEQAPGKQSIVNVPLGEGVVDFPAYFSQVRALGIGGPRSLHVEYAPFEPPVKNPEATMRAAWLAALRKDAANLQRFLGVTSLR